MSNDTLPEYVEGALFDLMHAERAHDGSFATGNERDEAELTLRDAIRRYGQEQAQPTEPRCATCGSNDPSHRRGVVRDGMDLCDDDGFHDTPRADDRGAS